MKEKELVFKYSKENPKEYWDKKAKIFFERMKEDSLHSEVTILSVLKEKNIRMSDLRILDVGCGFGRHMKFLKKISKECVGTDISEEMLGLAKKYVGDNEGVYFYCVDWNDKNFSLKANKFDVVFSSMCQAISSRESLEKFIDHSKNYCMIERALKEDNPLRKIFPDIDKDRPYNDWKYSQQLINLLWEMGYYPESKVFSYEREFILSHEEYLENKKRFTSLKSEAKLVENILREKQEYRYIKRFTKILIYWDIKNKR